MFECASGNQSLYDPLDVYAGSVEEGNPFHLSVAQDQRKLGTAEDQSIDAVPLLHLIDDRDQVLACFRQEDVVEQLSLTKPYR